MGVHTKTSSPKITSAFAHSKRRFSLPTWAQHTRSRTKSLTDATLRYSASRSQPNTFTKLSAAQCGRLACCAMAADT